MNEGNGEGRKEDSEEKQKGRRKEPRNNALKANDAYKDVNIGNKMKINVENSHQRLCMPLFT